MTHPTRTRRPFTNFGRLAASCPLYYESASIECIVPQRTTMARSLNDAGEFATRICTAAINGRSLGQRESLHKGSLPRRVPGRFRWGFLCFATIVRRMRYGFGFCMGCLPVSESCRFEVWSKQGCLLEVVVKSERKRGAFDMFCSDWRFWIHMNLY